MYKLDETEMRQGYRRKLPEGSAKSPRLTAPPSGSGVRPRAVRAPGGFAFVAATAAAERS